MKIKLVPAVLKEATEVIVREHYLHRGRTMGQIAYWIEVDEERSGVILFALPRMSATYHGYHPMELIELARMWLSPSIQGQLVTGKDGVLHAPSIASAAVGQALRRIRQDWNVKYPGLPLIKACVSWADQEHHEGTIYRASNFREVGTSGGTMHGSTTRKNGGKDQLNEDYAHLKTAFLYEYRDSI